MKKVSLFGNSQTNEELKASVTYAAQARELADEARRRFNQVPILTEDEIMDKIHTSAYCGHYSTVFIKVRIPYAMIEKLTKNGYKVESYPNDNTYFVNWEPDN